jgi:outer membrane protein assembly factor BamB
VSRLMRAASVLFLVLLLAGCQTVGGWFSRDKGDEGPAPLVDFSPTVQVDRVWSANVGRGLSRSQPNFRPFHHDGLIWVGDHRGRISAVNADSGQVVRRFDTELNLSSGPAVYDGMVLVGTFDGELLALDPANGNVRWQARLSSEMLSYPVLHDGVVVARCIDGRTFGIDASDGSRLWIHDRSVPLLTLRGNSDPLTRAGQVFIGYDDGMVVGLRVSDGSLLWEQRVSVPEGRTELERMADIDGPMAIVGTDLYAVTYRGRMASLALESGRILWVKEVASHSGLSLQRTQMASADREDAVWLIDRRNGSTLWRDDRLARRQITRPVFFGDYLVTVDGDGFMHWYGLESGDFAARVRASRSAPADAPLVVGNTLYLLDEDGSLTAWRPRG